MQWVYRGDLTRSVCRKKRSFVSRMCTGLICEIWRETIRWCQITLLKYLWFYEYVLRFFCLDHRRVLLDLSMKPSRDIVLDRFLSSTERMARGRYNQSKEYSIEKFFSFVFHEKIVYFPKDFSGSRPDFFDWRKSVFTRRSSKPMGKDQQIPLQIYLLCILLMVACIAAYSPHSRIS